MGCSDTDSRRSYESARQQFGVYSVASFDLNRSAPRWLCCHKSYGASDYPAHDAFRCLSMQIHYNLRRKSRRANERSRKCDRCEAFTVGGSLSYCTALQAGCRGNWARKRAWRWYKYERLVLLGVLSPLLRYSPSARLQSRLQGERIHGIGDDGAGCYAIAIIVTR